MVRNAYPGFRLNDVNNKRILRRVERLGMYHMKKRLIIWLSALLIWIAGCERPKQNRMPLSAGISVKTKENASVKFRRKEPQPPQNIPYTSPSKTIHVMVALADNRHQGIVPVPERLGNGQKPETNLYWGAAFGVKNYFVHKSRDWQLWKSEKVNDTVLERLVFRHRNKNFYLVADAYDGRYIRQAITDFLQSLAGQRKDTLHVRGQTVGIYGNASLVAYAGHDGLMDFRLENTFRNADGRRRDAIILACISRDYFGPYVQSAGANVLVWTTGLMAPEAYTLHDAIAAYTEGQSPEQIRLAAARAYHRYQKCGLRAAKHLLVSGE